MDRDRGCEVASTMPLEAGSLDRYLVDVVAGIAVDSIGIGRGDWKIQVAGGDGRMNRCDCPEEHAHQDPSRMNIGGSLCCFKDSGAGAHRPVCKC